MIADLSHHVPGHQVELGPDFRDNQAGRIQEAIDVCCGMGGGRVTLKPGRYDSGTIQLRSNVTLHLERDALLVGRTDIADYLHKEAMPTALIFADQAHNIGLTGEGTIDGNARSTRRRTDVFPEWVEEKKIYRTWIPAFESISGHRPLALVHFTDCHGIRLEEVRMTDSPRWTLHLSACSKIEARHLIIRSPADACNGDGIDLDGCSDALVEDCDIETGDDAICLKSSRTWGLERACRNIRIRRCRAFSTTHGFCIGHDTQDDFENIEVSDLEIGGLGEHPNLTGIGIGSVDGARIRNISLSQIRMHDVVAPFQIRLSSECRIFRGHTPSAAYYQVSSEKRSVGDVHDVRLEDILVTKASGNSIVSGLPGRSLNQIGLRNVHVAFTGEADPSLLLNEVPELESEYPRSAMWRFLPAHGFYFRHIHGLIIQNVSVSSPIRETRPAMMFKNVRSLEGRGIRLEEVQA